MTNSEHQIELMRVKINNQEWEVINCALSQSAVEHFQSIELKSKIDDKCFSFFSANNIRSSEVSLIGYLFSYLHQHARNRVIRVFETKNPFTC